MGRPAAFARRWARRRIRPNRASEELADALAELPAEQRAVFLAHEVEGRSFQELASETGLSINTLLSRKRYAVLYLRGRLRSIYSGFMKG